MAEVTISRFQRNLEQSEVFLKKNTSQMFIRPLVFNLQDQMYRLDNFLVSALPLP